MKKLIIILFVFNFLTCNAQQEDNNLKIAKDYFEFLFKKGDFESIHKIVDANAFYNQAAGLPYGGAYKGFDEWMKMFLKVSHYVSLELLDTPTFFTASGKNQVLAHFRIKFKSKKDNAELIMEITELIGFENGKIVSITPFYFDTKTFVDFLKL